MRIGLLGTRGIPARYSGFETCAEQLAINLAARGHECFVYCRAKPSPEPGWPEGIRLIEVPALRSKHFETLSHTLISLLHCILVTRPQALIVFNVGNAPVAGLARLLRFPVVFNVDGEDWRRDKWGAVARRYIRRCAAWAGSVSDELVTDSAAMQNLYLTEHGKPTTLIPYGSDHVHSIAGSSDVLTRWGLTARGYLLFVGRLVPENGAHDLVEAYRDVEGDMRLVIVGGATYSDVYIENLKRSADARVVFTGFQFLADYRCLSEGAYIFTMPARVGGTHPVLVEQMAFGNCVVARDTESNRETAADAGYYFSTQDDLTALLRNLVSRPDEVAAARRRAHERASSVYSWRGIADSYEALVLGAASRR